MYKYRLLHYIFEDKKTRLDLILILLLCLDSLRIKKKPYESCGPLIGFQLTGLTNNFIV